MSCPSMCFLTSVYVFYDCLKNDAEDYPKELTQSYTVSKRLGEGSYGEVRLAYRQVRMPCLVRHTHENALW